MYKLFVQCFILHAEQVTHFGCLYAYKHLELYYCMFLYAYKHLELYYCMFLYAYKHLELYYFMF